MKGFTVIAGPCSIDEKNIEEAIEIGNIPEVDAVRCVGLKSVTSPRPFMGIDKDWFLNGRPGTPPSKILADRIIKETGKKIAFELMDIEQLYPYAFDKKYHGRLFIWNPAINQLGWPMYRAATLAVDRHWLIGIKNAKWYGDLEADITPEIKMDNGQKTSYGLAQFVESTGIKPVMIQRGVCIPKLDNYRNLPDHTGAEKLLRLGYSVYFDPSHSYGEKMRDEIVHRTTMIMNEKYDGKYIYSGILVEVGTSQTDTGQHITIPELKTLIRVIKRQRGI